jgi:hypothetical protein
MNTTVEKEIEKFRKFRTKIMSEMLDNPDENGIFPTTDFYNDLDEYFHSSLETMRRETIQLANQELTKMFKQNTYDGDAAIVYRTTIAECLLQLSRLQNQEREGK